MGRLAASRGLRAWRRGGEAAHASRGLRPRGLCGPRRRLPQRVPTELELGLRRLPAQEPGPAGPAASTRPDSDTRRPCAYLGLGGGECAAPRRVGAAGGAIRVHTPVAAQRAALLAEWCCPCTAARAAPVGGQHPSRLRGQYQSALRAACCPLLGMQPPGICAAAGLNGALELQRTSAKRGPRRRAWACTSVTGAYGLGYGDA